MVFFNPSFYQSRRYATYPMAAVPAAMGANLRSRQSPFFSGSYATTIRKRKRATGRRSNFATKVRNLAPYKHNTQLDTAVTSGLTHGNIYTTNITSKITIGDTNADRDGDAIYLVSLKVNGAISTSTTAAGYTYRILVGWSGEEYAVTASTAGLVAAEIFLPNTGSARPELAIINPKAFTVLYDEVVTVNSQTPTTADAHHLKFNVPINQKFPYQAAGSTFGKTKNLYLVVMGGVFGGVSGTTSVGAFNLNTDMVFQAP